MSLKGRRFSLDSSVHLDGLGHITGKSKSNGKKPTHSHSLGDGRLEIQELQRLRRSTIAEESHEHSDGHVSSNSNSFVKHNKTFHKLFQEIPEEESLKQTFICALQKDLLFHGKLYVSENHVCFHSSMLLKETKVVIPASSVSEVKKHNSALSMLSVHTADGEKYSFVSLRNREMCRKLLLTVCSQVTNHSPHLSSGENEGDPDMASSYSSLEDCMDHDVSRQDSSCLENSFLMSSEGPSRCNSTRQNSIVEDNRALSRFWRIIERVSPFFILSEMRNLSVLIYFYIILMLLLLMASGYIGLRINALEEQLKSLGTLNELSLHHGQYQES